jgi:transcriptional regulator with XRE-family HTH domain
MVAGMTKEDATIEHTFGAVVRRVRTGMGLNQTQLGARLTAAGVSMTQQQVAKLETAQRPTRLNEAGAIADALGVPLGLMLRMETPTRLEDARAEIESRTRDAERAHADEAEVARAIEHLGIVSEQLDTRRRQSEVSAFLQESTIESLRAEIAYLEAHEAPAGKPTKRTKRAPERPRARTDAQKTKRKKGTQWRV